jgi:hypothetical protein
VQPWGARAPKTHAMQANDPNVSLGKYLPIPYPGTQTKGSPRDSREGAAFAMRQAEGARAGSGGSVAVIGRSISLGSGTTGGGNAGVGNGVGGTPRPFLPDPSADDRSSLFSDDDEVSSIFCPRPLGSLVVGGPHTLPVRDHDAGSGGGAVSGAGALGAVGVPVGPGGVGPVSRLPLRPKPQSPGIVWGSGDTHASPAASEAGPSLGGAIGEDGVVWGGRVGGPRAHLTPEEHVTGDGYSSSQGTSSSSQPTTHHTPFAQVDIGKVSPRHPRQPPQRCTALDRRSFVGVGSA